ncbi:MAG: hypothetical protein KC646_01495 [Candidatus Cloacimonetes bacterium]|nr:hypothetical protein [Candidatus Cloacimonadota bacterium]
MNPKIKYHTRNIQKIVSENLQWIIGAHTKMYCERIHHSEIDLSNS